MLKFGLAFKSLYVVFLYFFTSLFLQLSHTVCRLFSIDWHTFAISTSTYILIKLHNIHKGSVFRIRI